MAETLSPAQLGELAKTVDGYIHYLRCYSDPARVRFDLLQVFQQYPSLRPSYGEMGNKRPQYATNKVIFLAGTIPIIYQGVRYAIPVQIFIVEHYPRVPPICYVTPTPTMQITPRHPHCDSQGMVYHPYLHAWNPSSTLLNLIGLLCETFCISPPVVSKIDTPLPHPPLSSQSSPSLLESASRPSNGILPPAHSVSSPTQGPIVMGSSPSASSGGMPLYTPSQYQTLFNPAGSLSQPGMMPPTQPIPSMPLPQPPSSSSSSSSQDPPLHMIKEQFSNILQDWYATELKQIQEDIAQLGGTGVTQRTIELDATLLQLAQEKDQIQTTLLRIAGAEKAVKDWLAGHPQLEGPFNIDAATQAKDPIAQQFADLVAEDYAIDDMLYQLSRAHQKGCIDLVTYLKHVRTLSRTQFLKRATIKKISSMQKEQQK